MAQWEKRKQLQLEVQLVCVQQWSDLYKYLVLIYTHILSFLYFAHDMLQ